MSKFFISNIEINAFSVNDIFDDNKNFKFITTVNSEFVVLANNDDRFLNILNKSVSTLDGIVPYLYVKLKYPSLSFSKISGSDLIYNFIDKAKLDKKSIFLLGGEKEVNESAIKNIHSEFDVKIVGYSPPFEKYPFSQETTEKIKNELMKEKPNFLMVGFGAPKQEYWIDDNEEFLKRIQVEFAVGVGGTFGFLAGTEKRAPKLIQKIGLEWLFRTILVPSRIKRLLNCFNIFKYLLQDMKK